jgi:hypothetical protein
MTRLELRGFDPTQLIEEIKDCLKNVPDTFLTTIEFTWRNSQFSFTIDRDFSRGDFELRSETPELQSLLDRLSKNFCIVPLATGGEVEFSVPPALESVFCFGDTVFTFEEDDHGSIYAIPARVQT